MGQRGFHYVRFGPMNKATTTISFEVKYYNVALAYEHQGFVEKGRFPDDKIYLSEKFRKCSIQKAAKFSDENEARSFFDRWYARQADKAWRLDLSEFVVWEQATINLFGDEHPLWHIYKGAPKASIKYAEAYFYGHLDYDLSHISEKTVKKHRAVLLQYGIDILTPLDNSFNLVLLREQAKNRYLKDSGIKIWDGKWDGAGPCLALVDGGVSQINN